jgi:hypothetical protein
MLRRVQHHIPQIVAWGSWTVPDVLGVGPQPQIFGANLDDIANQLIAQHKERTNVA